MCTPPGRSRRAHSSRVIEKIGALYLDWLSRRFSRIPVLAYIISELLRGAAPSHPSAHTLAKQFHPSFCQSLDYGGCRYCRPPRTKNGLWCRGRPEVGDFPCIAFNSALILLPFFVFWLLTNAKLKALPHRRRTMPGFPLGCRAPHLETLVSFKEDAKSSESA